MRLLVFIFLSVLFCSYANAHDVVIAPGEQQNRDQVYKNLQLWLAIEHEQPICEIDSWLYQGADPNMTMGGKKTFEAKHPIELACERRNLAALQSLLSCDNGSKLREDGLRWLSNFNDEIHLEMAKIILDDADRKSIAIDMNAGNKLHLALSRNHYNMAKFLLESGADVNLPTKNRAIRPIFYAHLTLTTSYVSGDTLRKQANPELEELLTYHGVDRSLPCYKGKTINELLE